MITTRRPTADDGLAVAALVRDTGVLDVNSTYMYCLVLEHFGATSIVAELDGAIVGFVTAYRLPASPDVLFVWQVGVSEAARGQGLAKRMLTELLERDDAVCWMHTTVAPDNEPSGRLFRSLARSLDTDLVTGRGFQSAQLGDGHPDEPLYRIGPIQRSHP